MWKKVLAGLFALIGMYSIGYAYYNANMNAALGSYSAGGQVNGRIHQAPGGINGSNIGLRKGDKVYIGVSNPKDGSPLGWQLIYNDSGYEYYMTSPNGNGTNNILQDVPISAWFSASTDDIGSTNALDSWTSAEAFLPVSVAKYTNQLNALNGSLSSIPLVTYRDLTISKLISQLSVTPGERARMVTNIADTYYGRTAFFPSSYEIHWTTYQNLGYQISPVNIAAADLTFSNAYFTTELQNGSGVSGPNASVVNPSVGTTYWIPIQNSAVMRPFVMLDLKNAVFGLSSGDQQGLAKVSEPSLGGYTSLYDATKSYKEMKLRIYDSQLNAQLNQIQNLQGSPITKVMKNKTVNLSATANAGNDGEGGIYTVSALVFTEAGEFAYYRPLESAKGTGLYEFDLTDIPVGKYKVAIVNEAYNDGTTAPADSSSITPTLPLEIVDELKITVTPKTGLQVTINVKQGDAVATITKTGGVDPVSYEIIRDTTVTGHGDDYQLFAVTNGTVVVNDPNGLNAGGYYFKVKGLDANGDPSGGAESSTVHIVVSKVNTTIAFNDPNNTKKTINQANDPWDEIATANPTAGTKITYTIIGGDVGLIDLDPETGKVTYKGDGAFGKVKIKASVDDDPDTGNDNYNPSSTEKEITIVRELDAVVTPDSASSDADIPTFAANDANVKENGTIGVIKGMLGTPDTITGSITTYKYVIKNGEDGSFFKVNASNGLIQSAVNLAVGTYHFTITVSDHWTSKDIPVTVNVGVAKAEELKFYENSTSNTVINQKTVNFTDTNVTVFATVKGSSNSNPVTYKIKDGSSNVITINPNSGVVTIKGTGTVTIVAEKKGANGQADAQAELTFTVKPVGQNFIYTTDSTLSTERPKTGDKYNTLKETYAPNKTFKVYTTGNPAGSTVTYKLKDDSPTDVISVDSDGTIHILNASLNTQIGKVIVEATSHDPSGNYDDKTIELPIDIEKGTRKVEFAENPINVVNGTGKVVPSIKTDGKPDNDGTAVIEVDPNANDIAWTNDGETIEYEWNEPTSKDVKIKVTKPADRNYKAAEGEGILHILGADENVLTLSTPGKVTYGDHFTIRSTQDDSASTNVQYTFETDNGVFISAPQVNGNKAEFDALAYSGSTEVTIKVTRTADGELPLTKSVKIKVLPKPITIQIEDKEKKRLEENPPLTYKDFKPQLVEWNGIRDEIEESVIKLSTTAGKYSPIGTYPISAKNAQKQLNDNYPNYTFTIKEGKLNIKDNGDKNFWDVDDDGCPDLNIEISDDDGNTILINGDKNDDGIPDYNIDANGDGKPDLNIDTDNDGKPDLNLVMLKEWKPSKCVTLGDIQYASGITAKAEINIDLDNDGIPDINIDNKGDFKPHINISKDGKTPHVNIAIIHTWKPEKDYKKGNFSYDTMSIDEKKEVLTNIDTDNDGKPDVNIDLDGDGVPDINKDVDGDWIPDIDIDSTGDGKPDVNVDTDHDGIPDENIKEITVWKPEHNVSDPFDYDTMDFDDPKDPEDKEPDQPDKEVDGSYYPGNNVGGALTGDNTNRIVYIGIGCVSLCLLCLMIFKHNQEE